MVMGQKMKKMKKKKKSLLLYLLEPPLEELVQRRRQRDKELERQKSLEQTLVAQLHRKAEAHLEEGRREGTEMEQPAKEAGRSTYHPREGTEAQAMWERTGREGTLQREAQRSLDVERELQTRRPPSLLPAVQLSAWPLLEALRLVQEEEQQQQR